MDEADLVNRRFVATHYPELANKYNEMVAVAFQCPEWDQRKPYEPNNVIHHQLVADGGCKWCKDKLKINKEEKK